MKRLLLALGGLLLVLGGLYAVGPHVQYAPVSPGAVSLSTTGLPTLERTLEAEKQAGLKPDNEARIIWADGIRKQKTPVSMVYIPGFAASWAEGDPIHKKLARHFGCNLYLARPEEHGLRSPDALKNLTPANYAASAERALAIGKALGERVVVIGTSAGGMLTLYLAERHPELAALVLYSPCVATANPALKLATGPWGRQIMHLALPSDHIITDYRSERAPYWLSSYHTNGLIVLQTMLDTYLTPTELARVRQPVFMGYYYRDDAHQDRVVSVAAMQTMFDQLGTSPRLKRKQAFPNANAHVIASRLTSEDLNGVYQATEQFLTQVVKLPVIK